MAVPPGDFVIRASSLAVHAFLDVIPGSFAIRASSPAVRVLAVIRVRASRCEQQKSPEMLSGDLSMADFKRKKYTRQELDKLLWKLSASDILRGYYDLY
ncbi:hypothetical protein [Sporomusa malonica]|uniref:hypothetical protein n=1 Tax=Sporomusa malonica TaxID=112901 RepID=UPI0015930353|nr:hypothetical protein [Sporomusa malonica]